jgi:hypothetical protein
MMATAHLLSAMAIVCGEAVIPGVDGISDFNALHFGKHNEEVELDVLAMDGATTQRLAALAIFVPNDMGERVDRRRAQLNGQSTAATCTSGTGGLQNYFWDNETSPVLTG